MILETLEALLRSLLSGMLWVMIIVTLRKNVKQFQNMLMKWRICLLMSLTVLKKMRKMMILTAVTHIRFVTNDTAPRTRTEGHTHRTP